MAMARSFRECFDPPREFCHNAARINSIVMHTRREFLVNCSVVGFAASLTPTALAAARKSRHVELDEVTLNALAAQVNTAFFAHTTAGPVPLWLTGIETPREHGGLDAGNEKFTLVFVGAPEQALEQNTYSFEQSALGIFPLFISRVGSRDTTRAYYEAVFNRPPEAARRPGRGHGNFK